jgi:hypothetical protein
LWTRLRTTLRCVGVIMVFPSYWRSRPGQPRSDSGSAVIVYDTTGEPCLAEQSSRQQALDTLSTR